jgi:hypothetical protein
MVLLKRLMKDRNPTVRLRAIEAITKREERRASACPTCASASADAEVRAQFVDALTLEELDSLSKSLAEVRALRTSVYTRRPDLRPDHFRMPEPVVAVAATSLVAETAPPDAPRPVRQRRAAPVATADAAPTTLDRARWPEVGLEELQGVVTHALGDEHARAILAGEIAFEDAKAAHADAVARQRRMAASLD